MRVLSHLHASLLFLPILLLPAQAMVTVYSEDFETDGNGTRYNTSKPEFFVDQDAHFGRTDGTGIHVNDGVDNAYSGQNNSFFFAMENVDEGGGNTDPNGTFTTQTVNIAGSSTMSFSMLFAAGSSGSGAPSYENDDFLRVFVDFNGGATSTQLLGFETPLAVGSNQNILQDSDFNQLGEGAVTNDAFQLFSASMVPTGGATTAQIRIEFDAGGTSEEFAFDNLQFDVDQVPEPSTSILGLLGSGLLLFRRRRV